MLGIDDWSFRRGRKFGTILVDSSTHAIIDLLPNRSAETSATWMSLHPEIEVVSRDRGEDYAAARAGAPQTIQCADRFHLAKNLKEIVEEILARCRAEIRQASKPPDISSSEQKAEQFPALLDQFFGRLWLCYERNSVSFLNIAHYEGIHFLYIFYRFSKYDGNIITHFPSISIYSWHIIVQFSLGDTKPASLMWANHQLKEYRLRLIFFQIA